LHHWLQKKKSGLQQEVKEVLQLLPVTQQLITQSWQQSVEYKGWEKIKTATKIILANALNTKADNPLPAFPSSRQQIYILTGPIQSGKTTSLISWSANRNDVFGILTPIVNGNRVFMNAHNKEQFIMEAAEHEKEVLTVGKYTFSKANFDTAIQVIRAAIQKNGWLIIDEVGPLELKNEGFNSILKEVLTDRTEKTLVVVREGLTSEVENHFLITDAIVVNDIKKLPD